VLGGGVALAAVHGWPLGDRRLAVSRRLARALAERVLRTLHVDVQRVGPWPTVPALYVANHLSWLDILVLLVALPDARLVAKDEVGRWPLIGAFARAADTIFVARARRTSLPQTVQAIATRLDAATPVLLFAEGTTGDGSEVLPFRSSLFDAAARTGRPVVPIGLRLRAKVGDRVGARLLCWTGTMSLLRHLPLVAGTRRITCIVRAGAPLAAGPAPALEARVDRSRARKRLAGAAERAVRRLVIPRVVADGDWRNDPRAPRP
jgi:1-acyl-sn-glycerol-3-phosphate acyltransferase